ncbi:hypothetical protein [Microbulbifer pacificus]|uniref:Uncharacterized protein n=1 Tax=Microbulbifer pacificus TaxID=407164 RepID=A0AAU0MX81_9GAMM|nr:hypothetical protein [Microbulbifer pacificus]WOX05332.1 hypothetical protein R5R33_16550 [Microbulbifer pacificus]
MNNRLLYRQEDRKTLRKLATWIGCMMTLTVIILLGILLLN